MQEIVSNFYCYFGFKKETKLICPNFDPNHLSPGVFYL